jgi:DNA-binding transcriptional regulator YhcF (GntR family)
MPDGGWIKLHRSIRSHWLWEDGNEKCLKRWLDILMMVNHEDKKIPFNGKFKIVKRGEKQTSVIKLASRWGINRRTVDSFLDLLISDGMISVEKSKTNGTTLKVLHYNDYQDNLEKSAQPNTQQSTQRNAHKQEPKELKNNTTRKKREYDENSSPFKLAKYLYLKIQENDPNAKEPNFQTWADDARKLMELDKRSKENIYNVINWCQQDEFWSSNILSVKKLRSQFTQLFIKMNKDTEWLMRNTKQVSAGHEATDMSDLDRQQEENLRRAEEKYRKEHPELNE